MDAGARLPAFNRTAQATLTAKDGNQDPADHCGMVRANTFVAAAATGWLGPLASQTPLSWELKLLLPQLTQRWVLLGLG